MGRPTLFPSLPCVAFGGWQRQTMAGRNKEEAGKGWLTLAVAAVATGFLAAAGILSFLRRRKNKVGISLFSMFDVQIACTAAAAVNANTS